MNDVQLTGWFYLSFVDKVFLGGAFVRADEMIGATCAAHALGCNPGGEVMGVPVPEGFLPGPEYRERLLTKKEINVFWPDAKRIADMDDDSPQRVGLRQSVEPKGGTNG